MTEVDRSYSQYEEVRAYRDRGMMKWQGFYLSEHTSEMKKDKADKIYYKYLVKGYMK